VIDKKEEEEGKRVLNKMESVNSKSLVEKSLGSYFSHRSSSSN